MRVLVCSYIKTSRHPRRRGIRASASAPSLSPLLPLSLSLSRNACTRTRGQVAGSPTTACSLIFPDYLKSKSFYLSERMELSNDPAVFQHYIRLTSPYHGSSLDSPRLLATSVDSRPANVLFAGATRGRRSSASDLSLPTRERARLTTEDVAKRRLEIFFYLLFVQIAESILFCCRHLFSHYLPWKRDLVSKAPKCVYFGSKENKTTPPKQQIIQYGI